MTDSCPNCLLRGIRPGAARTRGAATVTGYRCHRCRHAWTTSRLNTAYPPATTPRRNAA